MFSTNLIARPRLPLIETIQNIVDRRVMPLFVEGLQITDQLLDGLTEEFRKLRNLVYEFGVEKCILKESLMNFLKKYKNIDIYSTAFLGKKEYMDGVFRFAKLGLHSELRALPYQGYISKETVYKCLHSFIYSPFKAGHKQSLSKRNKLHEV